MALWKTRTLSVDHRSQIAEEEQDVADPFLLPNDVAVVSDADASKMSKVYTCDLPCDVYLSLLMFTSRPRELTI